MELERFVVPAKVELRSVEGQPGKTLKGYAALYGVRSADLGGFVEEIARGAFDESLRSGENIMARAEHDTRLLLGTTENGTLRLESDHEGMFYEVDINQDDQDARNVAARVGRGDVRKSSFAFYVERPEDEDWTTTEEGRDLRIVKRARLVDVAPVANPAYPQTSVSARALETARSLAAARVKVPEPPPTPDADLRLRTGIPGARA